MDQMEAFTEIMVRRFYPGWPGVSPLFLKTSCLTFPEKRVFGELHAHEALLSFNYHIIYSRPGLLFHLEVEPEGQARRGVLLVPDFLGSSVMLIQHPAQTLPPHSQHRAEAATALLAHSLAFTCLGKEPQDHEP